MRFNAYLVRIHNSHVLFRFADCVPGRTEAGGRWAWALSADDVDMSVL